MKRGSSFLFLLIIFWLIIGIVDALAQNRITLKLKDAGFKELERVIKENFGYRFYYLDENVANARVSFSGEPVSLQEILSECEAQSNLLFEVDHQRKRIQLLPSEKNTVFGKILELGTESPLVGALIRSTTDRSLAATTDFRGMYSLSLSSRDSFEISHLGFETIRLEIDPKRKNPVVYLKADIFNLSEIVVVAYGQKEQKYLQGSIEKVLSKDLTKFNSSSFEQKLQGRVSGLQVISSSGESTAPVRMLVRGINSISAGVNPMIILDGTPIANDQYGLERSLYSNPQNPFSLINSNDIASIEVLKDAASTTLYGSRASNGILLITTKSGINGSEGFNFSYNLGLNTLSNPTKQLNLANTTTWFDILDKARDNTDFGVFNPEVLINAFPYTNPDGISRQEALKTNTQWFDMISRTGVSNDYQLSYQDVFDNANLYISGNYRSEKGVIQRDEFERYSLRANIDIEPSDRLAVKFRSIVSYSNKEKPINLARSIFSSELKGGFSQGVFSSLPWFPVYSSTNPSGYWNPTSGANLVASDDPALFFDDVNQYRYVGNLSMSYNLPFIKDISIKSSVGLDLLKNNNSQWISSILTGSNSFNIEQKVSSSFLNYNIFGEYKKEFDNHNLSLLSGVEALRIVQDLDLLIGRTPNTNFTPIGQSIITFAQDEIVRERYLLSYLGRVNYHFDERIFLEANYRLDGTSAFAAENRWSSFASIASAWILSEETFFDVGFINYLKLKGSYGTTGNQEVADNLFVTNYRNDRRYGDQELISGGTSIQSLGARDLSWESSKSFDVGLEYSLFGDKHYGSFTYFQQRVDDLLLEVPLPFSASIDGAFPIIWENTGLITNKGCEVELGINLHNSKSFNWNVSINYTNVKNQVNKLYSSIDKTGEGIVSRKITLTKKGGMLGAYYLASYAGIDQDKGVEMIHEVDQSIYEATGQTVKTGNLIPATRTNLINNRFYNPEKSGTPTYYGGINSTLDFKKFTLDILLSFMGGHYIFDNAFHLSHYPSLGGQNLQANLQINSWEQGKSDAKFPELRWNHSFDWDMEDGVWIKRTTNYNNINSYSDRFLQRGDFVRLRNIRLNYSFDVNWLRKLKLNSLDIYLSAQNLITFTKYKGLDPEAISINVAESINNLSPGFLENTPIPNLPSFNIGINVSF